MSAAATTVARDHAGRIYGIARRILLNHHDAEDATQDVLLTVVRKLDTFRGDSLLATWLHRVTVNAALVVRRKRDKNREMNGAGDALRKAIGREAEPEVSLLNDERVAAITEAIEQLPAPFRSAYVLADVDDLGNAEIAAQLGLSLSAVKSRLHRARLRMREMLAAYVRAA